MPEQPSFYRPRRPEESPVHRILFEHFGEFERVYPERFQERYGVWRPVVADAVADFLKCGDLREGFARVRCPGCAHSMFVGLSCNRRCVCASCTQKRSLLTAMHVSGEVAAPVPHRQFVFTIPKRFRLYFRKLWEKAVFDLLLSEGRINHQVVDQMRKWRHSGFSVDKSERRQAKIDLTFGGSDRPSISRSRGTSIFKYVSDERRRKRWPAAPPRRAGTLPPFSGVTHSSHIATDMLLNRSLAKARIVASKCQVYFRLPPKARGWRRGRHRAADPVHRPLPVQPRALIIANVPFGVPKRHRMQGMRREHIGICE